MQLQENKAVNLALAVKHIDGLLIRPGETFSVWKLIGRTTESRGYKEGLTITHGKPCKGIGGGDNLMAVLVSVSMSEMQLFYHLMQPGRELKMTSELLPPFLGDLLVTCYSQFSRNRTLGTMIGMGYSVKSAMLEMQMVAEGYYAVKSLENIRKQLNVEMPIAQAVYMVLYEGAKPDVILRAWQIKSIRENDPQNTIV
jgi:glycerol-3-phosphate dehydrogenase